MGTDRFGPPDGTERGGVAAGGGRVLPATRRIAGNALIAEQYREYPYYAIRSEIVETVLPDAESRRRVDEARPVKAGPGLVTIGYEGKSLERYLNQLLRAVCDVAVRRAPKSDKPEIWFFQKHVEQGVRRRGHPLRTFAGVGH